MPPADAERMSGGIGEHHVALLEVEIGVLQHGGTERSGTPIPGAAVVDVEVEVDLLLRVPIGPHRWNVIGGVSRSM